MFGRGNKRKQIDEQLRDHFNNAAPEKIVVSSKQLPGFRFPDIFNAIEKLAEEHEISQEIGTSHWEDLSDLLTPNWSHRAHRRINSTTKSAWLVDYQKETFLPVENFWFLRKPASGEISVIRLKFSDHTQQANLEVAAMDKDKCAEFLNRLVEWSEKNSIYRNKILHLAYEAGTKDEYRDVEKQERLRVLFRPDMNVTEKEFITDKRVINILNRNIVDLHERRDLLRTLNVPVRRGVLLHGPPGTGKTYACRYLCTKLPNTSRIFVSGSALTQVGAIFSLARMLQPAVLFLEDVDLIFSSREINLYSTALGDLLDQMDGLRAH